MENFVFNGVKDFYIAYGNELTTQIEKTNLVIFKNDFLEKLGSKLKLEFHYELHYSEKEIFVRFDCHCREYNNFINKSKSEYKTLAGNERYELRQKLKNSFVETFPQYRIKIYKYNYLCLLKKFFDNKISFQQALINVENFIEETYDKIIALLQQN